MNDVLVSIVNHHHVALLPGCVDSVRASTGITVAPVVLDNDSPDGSVEMMRRRYPDVELIAQRHADGFGANNNTIIAPRLDRARYMMLLNDDAVLEPEALRRLVDYMDAHPRVGIAGARLLYPDGSPQVSYTSFPSGWHQTLYLWGFGALVPKGVRRRLAIIMRPFSRLLPRASGQHLENWFDSPDAPREVDWVSGAALMARRETIEQIGLLDAESFFMYYEDTDWCLRARQAGWTVAFVPGAVVHHHQGGGSNPVTHRAWVRSGIRYFEKHEMPFDARLLRWNVGAKALISLAWIALTWPFRIANLAAARRSMANQRELLRLVRSARTPAPRSSEAVR